ncbi:MAG: GxxExxY protein [Flavobacteriales bacterium]|nr:GxxExxY protein [Flavobacteriales bacterium]
MAPDFPRTCSGAHEKSLIHELKLRNLSLKSQVSLPLEYKGVELQQAYKMDLLIEEMVIVELKCVEKILEVHEAQILTYMRHSKIRRGLILNFNVVLMKEGIRRFILNPK